MKSFNPNIRRIETHVKFEKARKFKKPASLQLTTVPVSTKEPTRKSKRVMWSAKKSSNALTIGVVIRETPMKSLSKKKEKMTVEKRKGIDLLSEVPLTEEAYEKGSNSKRKTNENESGSKSDQEKNEEEIKDDEEEEEDEFVKTLSNDFDDEDEIKIKDKDEGDKDEGIDYTTNQLYNDVDLRINEPDTTDEGLIQKEASLKKPIRKSKRVMWSAKKSSNALTIGVVIRETPVKSLSKKKEKMTVEKRKGIDLLCINLGELLPLSSTEVYLERQLVLTSFVFLEHRSFR
nr:hypothetical protein [Tanacetum cinerariifolium]